MSYKCAEFAGIFIPDAKSEWEVCFRYVKCIIFLHHVLDLFTSIALFFSTFLFNDDYRVCKAGHGGRAYYNCAE